MVLSVAPSVAACLISEETVFRKAVSVAPWKHRRTDVTNLSSFKMSGCEQQNSDPLYATVRKKKKTVNFAVVDHEEQHFLKNNNGNLNMFSGRKRLNFDHCATDEDVVRQLELKYGGKELAHNSAIVIQRGFRAARLQRQFSRLLKLALSTDRLDRRMSLLGPDVEVIRHVCHQ